MWNRLLERRRRIPGTTGITVHAIHSASQLSSSESHVYLYIQIYLFTNIYKDAVGNPYIFTGVFTSSFALTVFFNFGAIPAGEIFSFQC